MNKPCRIVPWHVLVDPTGAAYSASNGLAVVQARTTAIDYSVDTAAVPIAGYVLLATIPATPARASVEVQNQSATQIQIVRDDGAGNNLTSILAAPGAGAAAQGDGWSSNTFKGPVRVYALSSSVQVSAHQD